METKWCGATTGATVYLCTHLMQRVGSSKDLLAQQSVDSHLPPFQRTVRSPGQDLVQLEGENRMTTGTHAAPNEKKKKNPFSHSFL